MADSRGTATAAMGNPISRSQQQRVGFDLDIVTVFGRVMAANNHEVSLPLDLPMILCSDNSQAIMATSHHCIKTRRDCPDRYLAKSLLRQRCDGMEIMPTFRNAPGRAQDG